MYRNKHSLLPVQYYNKLPKECNVEVAIVLEPVIATGKASWSLSVQFISQLFAHYSISFLLPAGTIIATVAILKTWGVPKIKIVSTIASKQGMSTSDASLIALRDGVLLTVCLSCGLLLVMNRAPGLVREPPRRASVLRSDR